MPIYEYVCNKCNSAFELLVRSDTDMVCPECGSNKIEKQFSSFAAHEGGKVGGMPPCHSGGCGCDLGKCGSGMCGID